MEDDDALTWDDGTDDATHVDGRAASSAVAVDAPAATGSASLVVYGILAGAYLLCTIGWILASLQDQVPFASLLLEIMRQLGQFLAIAAPALWFATTFLLTGRRTAFLRIAWLVAGAVLLAPWPFILGAAA